MQPKRTWLIIVFSFQILIEELLYLVERNYLRLIVEVGMACAGNHHEELVVILTRGDGQFLVGIAAEIERMGFLSMKNHYGVLNLSGAAHKREIDPGDRRCRVATAIGIQGTGMITTLRLIVGVPLR